MAKKAPLRIVMIAAEAAPFVKVGGLGDVMGSLPKALARLGAEVSLIIPRYGFEGSAQSDAPCGRVPGFNVPMPDVFEYAEITQSRMPGNGISVYRIASRKYFQREGVYDDPSTREGYADNMERFIFFMKAAVELIDRLGVPFDVIHCHDSHTGLIPGLLRGQYGGPPALSRTRSLFTIHNLAYQGLHPPEAMEYAGIANEHFFPGAPFEFWGQVNFMKAGIELADKVNTVSPTYSREIQTFPEAGCGLEGVLKHRARDLSGIVNGIDYEEWDPEKDSYIASRYSIRDLSGKEKCKRDLLREFCLPDSGRRVPLIGMVSRLADQKGFDLVADAVEELATLDLQLVVLGTGQQKYHDLLRAIIARHPQKFGARLVFDNVLAHRIESGCDMFLMPSRYEPCGLNQLYSLRYGAVPIVRKTGGLADTVIPFDGETGTGFVFEAYSASAMMGAVRQALETYNDAARWGRLMVRGMVQDWSWDASAKEYLNLYRALLENDPR